MKKKKLAPGRHSELRDNPFPPPILEAYPPSMRIDVDPETNASIPTDQAVEDTKRWVDFNIK